MKTPHTHRAFLKTSAVAAGAGLTAPLWSSRLFAAETAAPARKIAPGPFQPTWESLKQNYRYPEWFRDAKFGIWAHWGPQCQPEMGDWYAQRMYQPTNAAYKFHVQKYGHPSKFGFKDVIHEWKAEKWEPEKLVDFYQKAGAKFFAAMANHHDNLDLWDSTYQPWNSVRVGPRKNIIGGWEKAARGAGMRFALSCHGDRAWSWYQVAQDAEWQAGTEALHAVPRIRAVPDPAQFLRQQAQFYERLVTLLGAQP